MIDNCCRKNRPNGQEQVVYALLGGHSGGGIEIGASRSENRSGLGAPKDCLEGHEKTMLKSDENIEAASRCNNCGHI